VENKARGSAAVISIHYSMHSSPTYFSDYMNIDAYKFPLAEEVNKAILQLMSDGVGRDLDDMLPFLVQNPAIPSNIMDFKTSRGEARFRYDLRWVLNQIMKSNGYLEVIDRPEGSKGRLDFFKISDKGLDALSDPSFDWKIKSNTNKGVDFELLRLDLAEYRELIDTEDGSLLSYEGKRIRHQMHYSQYNSADIANMNQQEFVEFFNGNPMWAVSSGTNQISGIIAKNGFEKVRSFVVDIYRLLKDENRLLDESSWSRFLNGLTYVAEAWITELFAMLRPELYVCYNGPMIKALARYNFSFYNYINKSRTTKFSDYLNIIDICSQISGIMASEGIEKNSLFDVDAFIGYRPNLANQLEDGPSDPQGEAPDVVAYTGNVGYNKIFYGVPGCGKSYHVQVEVLQNELGIGQDSERLTRVTFYPDYSNSDFIGQILPIVKSDRVSYEFVPGPFTEVLEKAYKNPSRSVALVVEELNRGNAAAIFGDTFQLLDRGPDGRSTYPIRNRYVSDYLKSRVPSFSDDYITLPSNMFILATMNTSDQGVFVLDTAFTRRWEFENIRNEFSPDDVVRNALVPCRRGLQWSDFLEVVNRHILDNPVSANSEDKQIGVHFADSILINGGEDAGKSFANKVIRYLWSDVYKYKHDALFDNRLRSFDEVFDAYIKGDRVFISDVERELSERSNVEAISERSVP